MAAWIIRKRGEERVIGFVCADSPRDAFWRIDELGYDPSGIEMRRSTGYDFTDGEETDDGRSRRWVSALCDDPYGLRDPVVQRAA